MKTDKLPDLTKEQEQAIIDFASPDVTVNDIAFELDINNLQIYRIIRKHKLKVKSRQKYHTEEQFKRIKELASPNITATEIAKIIGSERQRVQVYLRQHSLPHKVLPTSRSKEYKPPENGFFSWSEAAQIDTLFCSTR